jgi:hypothetical protein
MLGELFEPDFKTKMPSLNLKGVKRCDHRSSCTIPLIPTSKPSNIDRLIEPYHYIVILLRLFD